MRCEKFETLWNECLDERISPQSNEQLSAHAAVCPKCAELMAGGELLNFAFPGLPQPALSANFSDRVVASLRAQESKTQAAQNAPIPVAYEVFAQAVNGSRAGSNSRKRFGSKIIYWASGVAAAIAVIATVALTTTPKDGGAPKMNLGPAPVNVVNVVRPIVKPRQAVTKVSPPRVSPANGALAVSGSPANDYFPASSTMAVGTVFRRDSMSQVGFAVADGITPVTKSVTFALQSFPKTTAKEPNQTHSATPNRSLSVERM